MGNWNINIQGTGPYDTEEFRQAIYGLCQHVSRLGNRVESATLTFGGRQDFLRNVVTRESIEGTAAETAPKECSPEGPCLQPSCTVCPALQNNEGTEP